MFYNPSPVWPVISFMFITLLLFDMQVPNFTYHSMNVVFIMSQNIALSYYTILKILLICYTILFLRHLVYVNFTFMSDTPRIKIWQLVKLTTCLRILLLFILFIFLACLNCKIGSILLPWCLQCAFQLTIVYIRTHWTPLKSPFLKVHFAILTWYFYDIVQ